VAASEPLDPWAQLHLPRPGAARLLDHVQIALSDRVGIEVASAALLAPSTRPFSALRTPPSMTKCATWMPLGPSSRAIDCASPRKANLPIANTADCGQGVQ
jgi:hypothetical protein